MGETELTMKKYRYVKAVLAGLLACFLLENGDVARAQGAPSYCCGSRANFHPQHDHRTFAWEPPPVQLRIPYFNPNAAAWRHQCFDTGHYVVCYPYPAPSYQYY
jgi:hypothetical protein